MSGLIEIFVRVCGLGCESLLDLKAGGKERESLAYVMLLMDWKKKESWAREIHLVGVGTGRSLGEHSLHWWSLDN